MRSAITSRGLRGDWPCAERAALHWSSSGELVLRAVPTIASASERRSAAGRRTPTSDLTSWAASDRRTVPTSWGRTFRDAQPVRSRTISRATRSSWWLRRWGPKTSCWFAAARTSSARRPAAAPIARSYRPPCATRRSDFGCAQPPGRFTSMRRAIDETSVWCRSGWGAGGADGARGGDRGSAGTGSSSARPASSGAASARTPGARSAGPGTSSSGRATAGPAPGQGLQAAQAQGNPEPGDAVAGSGAARQRSRRRGSEGRRDRNGRDARYHRRQRAAVIEDMRSPGPAFTSAPRRVHP